MYHTLSPYSSVPNPSSANWSSSEIRSSSSSQYSSPGTGSGFVTPGAGTTGSTKPDALELYVLTPSMLISCKLCSDGVPELLSESPLSPLSPVLLSSSVFPPSGAGVNTPSLSNLLPSAKSIEPSA